MHFFNGTCTFCENMHIRDMHTHSNSKCYSHWIKFELKMLLPKSSTNAPSLPYGQSQ
jgi:hypothetical protein